jgi:hypothetical protein
LPPRAAWGPPETPLSTALVVRRAPIARQVTSTANHRPKPHREAKMWHEVEPGCPGSVFGERCSRKALATCGLGEDNGNNTHDTSGTSNNIKSVHLYHRTKNVREWWRRFPLRALWTRNVAGFRSFNNLEAIPSTSAPFVKTTMISHLRRVMIATGQRDDPGRRLDLRSWGLNPGMSTVAR